MSYLDDLTPHEELIEEIKGIQRIVINVKYGGFSLSGQAIEMFKKRAGITDPDWYGCDLARDDPVLVAIVRELGADANGDYAALKIVEVPYGVDWTIEEYDGTEWVAEKHRTWE
jgi:hypothetical protein